jgi:hypothetical protein
MMNESEVSYVSDLEHSNIELQGMIRKLQDENKQLRKREQRLDALEKAGVDNWEGYEYAMYILEGLEGNE